VDIRWTKKDVIFSAVLLVLALAFSAAFGAARDARSGYDRVSGELEQIRAQYAALGSDLIAAERRSLELTDDLNRAYNGTLEIAGIGTELEGSITESIAATMGIGRNIARLTDTVDELERVVRVYQDIVRSTTEENAPP
jgi:hypothetical protein